MEELNQYYHKTPKMKSIMVYEEMKKDLLAGKWELGEKILVNELIEKFNVSRRPVMDAMKMLENDGYIEIIPQSGCKVIDYSKKNIIDQLLLSSALETFCAGLAALNHKEEEIELLENYQSRMLKNPEKLKDKFNYLKYTRETHFSIFLMTHSELIKNQTIQIWNLTDFYLLISFDYLIPDPMISLKNHDNLIHAIKNRDEKQAKITMEVITLSYIEKLKDILP